MEEKNNSIYFLAVLIDFIDHLNTSYYSKITHFICSIKNRGKKMLIIVPELDNDFFMK